MSYAGLGETSTELRARAREQYAQAQEAFNAGNFSTALQGFLAAYRTYSLPTVLIAIASTYAKLGQPQQAAQYAQRYLYADPGGEFATRARGIINAATPSPSPTEVPSTFPETSIDMTPAIEDVYAERTSIAIWVLTGAGVLGLIGAGVWLSRSRRVAANRRRRARRRTSRRA